MFYKTYRSTSIVPRGKASGIKINRTISLSHDERCIRRKLLCLNKGDVIMLDFKEMIQLTEGDLLETEDKEYFYINAAIEPLYKAQGKNVLHFLQLLWHLGNRHVAIEIFPDHVTLLRDHVIYDMLKVLGASVQDVDAPFHPLRGAYHEQV